MIDDRTAQQLQMQTRRELLQRVGCGIGSVALTQLLMQDGVSGRSLAAQQTVDSLHHRPRAKQVIFLHMVGAPSHLDLFEPKPVLNQNDGEPCPDEFLEGQRFAFLRGHPKLMGSPFKFQPQGGAGTPFSELLPQLSTVADEICMLRTLHTEQFNHAPAQLFFQTGFPRFGRPSAGAWISYGMGSINENLPSFVVMVTGTVAGAGNSLWGSGFLPTSHQGIEFRSNGDPVHFLSNPPGVERSGRRRTIDSIQTMNQAHYDAVGDPEILTRIQQYEMAFRMQASVPELLDTSQETDETMRLYGAEPGKPGFANNCLLARRMVERGVRFVQLFDQGWDHHGGIVANLRRKAQQVDQPVAALLTDLKRRGLLDETLVVWGAEFGRTPMLQGDRASGAGRDHHKDAYCIWMAGGGSRPGTSVGQTDEIGYFPVEDPVSVHDFHATMLHLLGIDHTRLTFRVQGRDFRLTDVAGNVISKAILS